MKNIEETYRCMKIDLEFMLFVNYIREYMSLDPELKTASIRINKDDILYDHKNVCEFMDKLKEIFPSYNVTFEENIAPNENSVTVTWT